MILLFAKTANLKYYFSLTLFFLFLFFCEIYKHNI